MFETPVTQMTYALPHYDPKYGTFWRGTLSICQLVGLSALQLAHLGACEIVYTGAFIFPISKEILNELI